MQPGSQAARQPGSQAGEALVYVKPPYTLLLGLVCARFSARCELMGPPSLTTVSCAPNLPPPQNNKEQVRRLTTPHLEFFLKKTARRPLAAVAILTRLIHWEYAKKNITNMEYESMNKCLHTLIQGFNGVDKVHTVQIPFPYAQMILLFLTLYVFTAPFMFVTYFGWGCFLPASALCCAFFGINEVFYSPHFSHPADSGQLLGWWSDPVAARSRPGVRVLLAVPQVALEIEDPFGEDENDLPLDPMGDALKADIECALEMNEVPLDNIRIYWDKIDRSKARWTKLESARTNQARHAQEQV